ncbi:hypothetical protein SAMN05444722_1217 [Rhodovulum sp. ES.010]|uniref:hypothetical protein n=1 Tax=Rhodovulum sp. ES.010 TaxID=1882821 RepID=UPI00092801F3|nr:hypothetical protein [Rhodovulum sp. ES.010]SIO28600.1 hypothetical protein SAMN05444722_1217 [Rhodovulum sp. ES.010]
MDDSKGPRAQNEAEPLAPGGPGAPMMLELVLLQLQMPAPGGERARERARLAFLQWLASLPGHCDFPAAVRAAAARTAALGESGPSVAAFRALLAEAEARPSVALDLSLPRPRRRGGARARRMSF